MHFLPGLDDFRQNTELSQHIRLGRLHEMLGHPVGAEF